MTDDKKPKIDLKSRLQKISGPAPAGATPAPGQSSPPLPTVPPPPSVPFAANPPSRPAPPMPPRSVPVPPGSTPPPPVAMGSQPAPMPRPAPSAPSPGMPQPVPAPVPVARPVPVAVPIPAPAPKMSLEIDEVQIEQVRKDARKKGMVTTVLVGIVLGVLGLTAGRGLESRSAREKSVNDAKDLEASVNKARAILVKAADDLEAARASVVKEGKFPDHFATDLNGFDPGFDGTNLFGKRFTAISAETTKDVYDFIARVTAFKDKQRKLGFLVGTLQKPIADEAAMAGKELLRFGIVIDKDSPTKGGDIEQFLQPLEVNEKTPLPATFTFAKAEHGKVANVTLPRYTGGALPKEGAAIIHVTSRSFSHLFPDDSKRQANEMVREMSIAIHDVRGDKPQAGEAITEPKPGLEQIATKLALALHNVK